MERNIFLRDQSPLTLDDYMHSSINGRENLGLEMPVMVYRLFQYSLKDQLTKELGKDKVIDFFRKAGYEAGVFFCHHFLDASLPFNDFAANLQQKMLENKIGILRIEKFDPNTGHLVLTVAEDCDCSGMPLLGETVCNYDEGFIAGILSTYTKTQYQAIEVDCWATGDRVCRFQADIVQKQDPH